MAMRETDEAVARRVIGGDRDAFQILVDRYARKLYRIAWRFLESESDADDVVQDTFIKAWDKLHTFDPETSFSAWICQIAANRSRDLLRKRRNPDRGGVAVDALPSELVSIRAEQERRLTAGEVRGDLRSALGALSESERIAFQMRHFEGMSIDEIGHVLGTRTNATKSAIFRAVKKLREALAPGGERRHAFE